MKRTFRCRIYYCGFSILAVLCALPAVAAPITVFTNLQDGFSANFGVVVGSTAFHSNQVPAEQFVPATTVTLADAILALVEPPVTAVTVYLESDNNGLPGALLDTLTQMGAPPLSPVPV
jgi:hypothetical protein